MLRAIGVDVPQRVEAARPSTGTQLTGRIDECRRLSDALQEAASGRPASAFWSAPPTIMIVVGTAWTRTPRVARMASMRASSVVRPNPLGMSSPLESAFTTAVSAMRIAGTRPAMVLPRASVTSSRIGTVPFSGTTMSESEGKRMPAGF